MDGCFLYYIDRESSPSVEYVDPPPAETGAKRREEEEEERELARLYVDEKCIASVLSSCRYICSASSRLGGNEARQLLALLRRRRIEQGRRRPLKNGPARLSPIYELDMTVLPGKMVRSMSHRQSGGQALNNVQNCSYRSACVRVARTTRPPRSFLTPCRQAP